MFTVHVLMVLHRNQTIGGWSSEGIIQSSNPGLPVVCNTTHLTSFAVLVSTANMKVCTDVVTCNM